MNKFLNKAMLAIIFSFFANTIFAQHTTDGKFLFKMWLFLEHDNSLSKYSTTFPVKDSSVFNLFITKIDLKLDTLKSIGFPNKYIFLALTFNKAKGTETQESPVFYEKKTSYLEYIDIPSFCSRYVLCINKLTGTSFRLQGFTGNDFNNLFSELVNRDDTQFSTKNNITIKSFLKKYYVEGIDFKCIYEGLKSNNNLRKYSCLSSCKKSNQVIWTQ